MKSTEQRQPFPEKWKIQLTPETKDTILKWFESTGWLNMIPEDYMGMMYYASSKSGIITEKYFNKTKDTWPEITFEQFEKQFLTEKTI